MKNIGLIKLIFRYQIVTVIITHYETAAYVYTNKQSTNIITCRTSQMPSLDIVTLTQSKVSGLGGSHVILSRQIHAVTRNLAAKQHHVIKSVGPTVKMYHINYENYP